MGIKITEEFRHALDAMNAGENVLLTGKAGTGKSTLLRRYLDQVGNREVLVTAPTGVAALNIDGFTIHRTFGFRPGMYPDDIKPGGQWRVPEVLRVADVLVVDEISMVRSDLFDMMNIALQRARGNTQPFGGIQLILVGDLLQLPPVVTKSEAEYFSTIWDSPYFFSAHCYDSVGLTPINLSTVWRQTDDTFLEVLNQVREGSVSDNALTILNERVDADFDAPDGWVTLASRKSTVDKLNHQHLNELGTQQFESMAQYTGNADKNSFSSTEELRYATGARVMTVINDPRGRFVNGSFGTILRALGDSVTIQLDHSGQTVELGKHTWKVNTPGVADGKLTSESTGSVTQFPFILAWAITVHKSQGKTIPQLYIDLTGGMTTDGQFYVALSRGVGLDTLRFSAPIERRHIRANNSLVRMIRRETTPSTATSRVTFLAVDGVHFGISDHIARAHAVVVESGTVVADFGTWINPMSDLGEFGAENNIPPGGLALAPTLGDFWPLLLRQAAGSIIVGDGLSMLERAVRHQEKGMDLALGMGFEPGELDFTPTGNDVVSRSHSMAQAYLNGQFAIPNGQPVPQASASTEGSIYLPQWAPSTPVTLDPFRATDSDNAWAAFSGANLSNLDHDELVETAEILSAWAVSRGFWNDETYAEVSRRAARAGVSSLSLPEVESDEVDIPTLFRPGTRVAFTGRNNLLGGPADDDRLKQLCLERNLEYKTGVSRTRCDVLVAGDPASMSTKAKNAREYGKPIVSQADFEEWYHNGPFLGAEVEAEPQPEPKPEPQATEVVVEKLEEPEWVSPHDFMQEGTRVAFRGSTHVDGERYPHGEPLQNLCDTLGLEYKQAVTKTRCDVLVTDIADATDGKMKLAARYGTPLMKQEDFQRWASQQLADIEDDLESLPSMPPVTETVEDTPPRVYVAQEWTPPQLPHFEIPVDQYDRDGLPLKQPSTPAQANQPIKAFKRAKQTGIGAVVAFVALFPLAWLGMVNAGAIALLVSMVLAAVAVIFLVVGLVQKVRK